MPRLSLTQREVAVTRDVMQRLSAYSREDFDEFLDWDDEDVDAWSDALDKLTRLAEADR